MSGKVPPSSRANREGYSRDEVGRAIRLYEQFTGHDAEELGVFSVPAFPEVATVIGECDGVLYTAVRDGQVEKYIHRFRSKDKPLLCVSANGRQLLLIGGRYVFTERGIVDQSDRVNYPR